MWTTRRARALQQRRPKSKGSLCLVRACRALGRARGRTFVDIVYAYVWSAHLNYAVLELSSTMLLSLSTRNVLSVKDNVQKIVGATQIRFSRSASAAVSSLPVRVVSSSISLLLSSIIFSPTCISLRSALSNAVLSCPDSAARGMSTPLAGCSDRDEELYNKVIHEIASRVLAEFLSGNEVDFAADADGIDGVFIHSFYCIYVCELNRSCGH